MRTHVVYESMWGNTAMLAEAIGQGLGDVPVSEVNSVTGEDLRDADLIVIGGPTHAFSMSREQTRQSAHEQGASSGRSARGIRDLLAELPNPLTAEVATFDSRVLKVRKLPGSAARAAAKELRRHHHARVVGEASFYVEDSAGPLADGELERARAWGADLAARTNSTPRPA
jgi:hypothetical protein